MRVFVTGASGWIGSAVVPQLLAAGHEVEGLVRTEEKAAALRALGATARLGDLDDLDGLRAGAEASEGVVHLAFKHDFSDMAGAGRTERAAVEAMATALEGSDRPFLFASGIAMLAPGRVLTERDASPMVGPDAPRGGGENFALEFVERGVRSVALRFAPTVHGQGDYGFLSVIAAVARQKGVAGYIGDGSNRWPAVNRADAAAAVALALENAPAGTLVHAVGEEGISAKEIAEALGRTLGVPTASIAPEAVAEHFGWIGMFFGVDMPASSVLTQELLGWTPTHPGLLADIEAGYYPGR
ncbi:SDR family oxidoreductase [Herbiconiux sp. 11R-BC]|uniref:SDR family oxidoreductase n=1 Tax=Herbiconiux sp. 11R-BC TaxID=3111637 RepID=UPI003C023CE7